MRLDVMQLKSMHPLLPSSKAAEYGHLAAVGLERHRHETGVALTTLFHSEAREATLHWVRSPSGDAKQLDRHRVTEDAAEAIALALVHVARGWVVKRRLQRGESADWLLEDPEAGLIALEVSGIDKGDDSDRIRIKLEQVGRATVAKQRSACVVVLSAPRATIVAV